MHSHAIPISAFLIFAFGVTTNAQADEELASIGVVLRDCNVSVLHESEIRRDDRGAVGSWMFQPVVLPGDQNDYSPESRTPIRRIRGLKFDNRSDTDNDLSRASFNQLDSLIPRLEYLVIEKNWPVTKALIDRLPEFTNLRYLCIEFSQVDSQKRLKISDRCVRNAATLNKLEELALNRIDIREPPFRQLSRLKNLRTLRIMPIDEYGYGNRKPDAALSGSVVSEVLANMPKLETLVVSGCSIGGELDWKAIQQGTALNSITINRTAAGDDEIAGIGDLAQLEELNLRHSAITGNTIADIAQLTSLKILDIRNTQVRDQVTRLNSMPNVVVQHSSDVFSDEEFGTAQLEFLLRTAASPASVDSSNPDLLSLTNINSKTDGIISIDESEGLLRISYHVGEAFRTLSIQRRLSARDFDELRTLDRLSSFTVSRSLWFGHELTQHIAGHPTIERIRLNKVRLDERLMEHLVSLPLSQLNIQQCEISDNAFRSLHRATRLEQMKVWNAKFLSDTADRLNGLAGAPTLKSLTIVSKNGNDADCRQIGKSQTIESLRFHGNFSNQVLPHFTGMQSLQSLSVCGISDLDPHRDPRVLTNPKLKYVQFHPKNLERPDGGGQYSEAVTRELDFGMAGDCSCSCMDSEAPDAVVVPRSSYNIQDNHVLIDPQFLKSFANDPNTYRSLRITDLPRQDCLKFNGGQLPSSCRGIYFNNCELETFELTDCRREIGVFGNVAYLQVREEGPDPSRGSELNMFLAGVKELEFLSARRLESIWLTGSVESVRLSGDFPMLSRFFPGNLSGLKYLAAPYSGSAPALALSSHLSLGKLKQLRLLKIPGTGVTDEIIRTADSPLHEIDLRRTRVTDLGVLELQRIKSLKVLKLSGCRQVTEDAITIFRRNRPDVRIEH